MQYSLYRYLIEESIDDFQWMGRRYNTVDLVLEDAAILDFPMSRIIDGGELVEIEEEV